MMRNDGDQADAAEGQQLALQRHCRFRVERRGRLVEHGDGGIAQYGARDRQALALAAGKVLPTLEQLGVDAVRQAGDEFLKAAEWGKVWGFPAELYLPIFHFCREFGVPMLALNCYRELVTRIGKEGWDAVPVDERDGLTPSADATPAYRQYLFDITGGGSPTRKVTSPQAPEFDRFVRAQQTWDRAFACNIAKARTADSSPLVIGIIGRGHLEFGHGTPFQLKDLGVDKVTTLLPNDTAHRPGQGRGNCPGLFRLQPQADARPAA